MTEFYSVCGKRPVRLSESTRALCAKALSGFFGRRIKADYYGADMDDIEGFATFSARKRYDSGLRRVVEECPVYINDDELFVGSAATGMGMEPTIPIRLNGKPQFGWGANHLTPGFDFAVERGIDALEEEVTDRLKDTTLTPGGRELLESIKNSVDCLHIWHDRYMNALDQRIAAGQDAERLTAIRDSLKDMPFKRPATFRQALQSLWFMFAYARLMSNWPGLGRVDKYLWPFLDADLKAGTVTMDEARELVAHFLIKGSEWVTLDPKYYYSGDAQHYQNIVLGGVDRDGKDITNPVSYLILEVLSELPVSDFPIAVRLNGQTPDRMYRLIAENTRHGGGVVGAYDERTVISAMIHAGYDPADAVDYTNDGCWETLVPGKTWFSYRPFDGYACLQKDVLGLDGKTPDYKSFDEMYGALLKSLGDTVESIGRNEFDKKAIEYATPVPFIELITKGCVQKALPYFFYGPVYNTNAFHIGGFADIVDALYAIKKFVFDSGRYTLEQYTDMLRADWEGFEAERSEAINTLSYYGNDNDECDAIAVRLNRDFIEICDRGKGTHRYNELRPAGISTFGRQVDWKDMRFAHAHGHKGGAVLANNCSPTPGSDRKGVTAAIRSFCKCDFSRLGGSTALDIKFDPSVFKETDATEIIKSLLQGFCELGGYFIQMDTMDATLLRKAQENPEQYAGLVVRVSGWSARFITIKRDWQNMIIERTEQEV